MSNPPFKGAVPLLEKSIFLHNICSIIDIEHPFQKRNMFETVSTIKECSFASYHWTTEYCPVWQKIFLWRSSILAKLDYFCLTCVLVPLVRSAQPSFRQFLLKEMFSIQSNNNVFVQSNISLISRGCCTNSTTDSSRTIILFQKSATCIQYTVYHMFKQCLIVLRFKDAHSSNYNIFQQESCLHQRVLFPKYGSLSWKNITLCIQKNDVQSWRTYFTCLHVPFVLELRKYIVERALHVQEGSFLT